MGNLDNFKSFVKQNPGLIKYVKNNEMTWQKFYDVYNLYGEEESVWKDYLVKSDDRSQEVINNTSINGFLNWLKAVDMDTVQEGVSSLQRVVGVIGDLTNKSSSAPVKEEYKPRPLYKHFDD
ncbi:MAG: spore coat protein YlbD [Bacilli bacterium]|nr:spore coat protein YlbD [Bacilli bacterium]MDD4809317.1 spore coat protein YlbD [Bacilli bacterium]